MSASSPDPVRAQALLLTEQFPPAVGGTAHLFASVYGRLGSIPVTVLTDDRAVGDPGETPNVRVLREPISTPHWGLLRPAGLRHHLRMARRLRSLSAETKTVVHCGRVVPEGLDAWLARMSGGPRYVCWAHGEELTYVRWSRELRVLMKLVYRNAAALLANSQNTAELLDAFGVSRERIHVIYPGVDTGRFTPDAPGASALRERLARPDEQVVLTVGRLQRRKGHDLVIRALQGLEEHRVRYVIVGDGEERVRLEKLAEDQGVRDTVTFAGVVTADELPAYYAAADIFVHPNRVERGDFEGFGLVFVEAAAAGLPVIGGASGGVPEAVDKDRTGLLVGGNDVGELRDALVSLLRSPAKRDALGAAGRSWAARFTWARAAAGVVAAHERVADA